MARAKRGAFVARLPGVTGGMPGAGFVLTRWTPHGWPCFKRSYDPPYFGDFVIQNEQVRSDLGG